MKILINVAAFVAGITIINAQNLKESEVPQAVKSAFKAKFPDVNGPEWDKEGNDYEAEFDVKRISVNMENGKAMKKNIERTVLFSSSGDLLQTEDEIKLNELPAAVNEYVAKNLGGKKIKEAAKITMADGKIMYEAEVEKDDYIFDANGNFMKKEIEENDDDDEGRKNKKVPF